MRFPEFTEPWENSTIGDSFELYSGNTPSRLEKEQFAGDINWITSGELKNHYILKTNETITKEAAENNNLRLLPIGTFVIAIYGLEADGVRSTGSITSELSTISQACMAFLPKRDISNEFLYSWYMKHGNTIGLRYAQGTKQQNLSYDIIEKFRITYPSKAEQQKLEYFIGLLDRRIAVQSKLIEQLESLIKGICHDFHNHIKGWLQVSFSELGTDYGGLSNKTAADFGEGKPFITYLNVYTNRIVNENHVQFVNVTDDENQNKVKWGDVLFTLSSETPDEVAVGSVYLGNNNELYLNSFCFGIHIDNEQLVFQPYLAYLISSPQFRKWVFPLAQGSTRFNLQKADFMKKKFLLPPLDGQKKLYQCLNSISRRIVFETSILDDLQELKQSLLQQMLI